MPPIAVFTLCWQIALGGQLGAGQNHCAVALSLPDGRDCGGWASVLYAITSCNPQLVL
ncbi:hypothetical protein ACLK2I_12685 [Escherichia coli]